MNGRKQHQLMRAAGKLPAVAAPSGFDADVLRAIRRDASGTLAARSLADQLTLLFPRIAVVALALIAAVAAFELWADGDFLSQLALVSDQWLLPLGWL